MHNANHVYQWTGMVLALILCSLGGCSLLPVEVVMVNSASPEPSADIPLVAGTRSQHKIGDINSGDWNNGGRIGEGATWSRACRIKYHPCHSKHHLSAVKGRLGNGRTYPVILDTGTSAALVVNDIHLLENERAIRPCSVGAGNSAGWGRCHISELHIGKVTLLDWPCFYREQHMEIRLFGLPVSKDRAIIAGLPALQRFRYVAFDGAAREVEFSVDDKFEPGRSKLWTAYPFEIEEDSAGNAFLFVTVPIAGAETKLQLDTGSANGLALSAKLWERIGRRLGHTRLTDGKDLYPYIGQLPCKRSVVPDLHVGGRSIRHAMVSVFPDDCLLLSPSQGLLGMQYFQDAVLVLDFDRDLMWVGSPQN